MTTEEHNTKENKAKGNDSPFAVLGNFFGDDDDATDLTAVKATPIRKVK